jgi:hypothetical protein
MRTLAGLAHQGGVMDNSPWTTGPCCPKGDVSLTQLRLSDDGHTAGIIGLGVAFEQLLAMGRAPAAVTDEELLGMVRAQRNYITPQAGVETLYAAALRREYAAFYARRVKE